MAKGAQYESLGVVKIRATSAGLSVFDMAGKKGDGDTPQGEAMVAALKRRFGDPSRIMWPNAERKWQEVETNLEPVVRRVSIELTRLLGEK
jgi:hypothetical protein